MYPAPGTLGPYLLREVFDLRTAEQIFTLSATSLLYEIRSSLPFRCLSNRELQHQ